MDKHSKDISGQSEHGEDKDNETRCGYWSWRPGCLQKCSNSKALLASLCCFTFTQGFVVMGINNVNTTTLERRFDLRSTQVAWITSAYDVASAALGILIGYLTIFCHKGRMLTVGASVMAIGSFIMFLPHILVGNYELGTAPPLQQCDKFGNASDVECATRTDASNYIYVFILGQICHAVGGTAVFNIGLIFLDDSVRQTDTALYVGIMHTFASLGPALGILGGGALLEIYVDIGRVDMDDITLTPSDPRWVGAWWIGFVISAICAFVVSFLMACFPKELPETKKIRKEKVSEAYKGTGEEEMVRKDFGKSWKDIALALKVIFTNIPWIFITIAASVEMGAVNAFATFLPKVLQFQYRLSAGQAALFAGAIILPGACGGQLLGGIIPKCLSLRLRGLLVTMTLGSIVAFLMAGSFLLKCDMPSIAGVNVQYLNVSVPLDEEAIVHPCNEKCHCTTQSYEPICGHDGVEYFSPCYAGCDNMTQPDSGDTVYSECSCVAAINDTKDGLWDAKAGSCDEDCTLKFVFFLIMFLVMMMATFIKDTIGHTAIIRCVPDKQRGFAYGIQQCISKILGGIPFPILMGAIFDSTCLIWQETCDISGACWIYDTDLMGQRLCYCILVVEAVSGISFFIAFMAYKAPPEVILATDVSAILSDKQIGTGMANGTVRRSGGTETNESEHSSTQTYETIDNNVCVFNVGDSLESNINEDGEPIVCEVNDLERSIKCFFTPSGVDSDISKMLELPQMESTHL